jgi:tetratricopeptide (TPR) repeat protein
MKILDNKKLYEELINSKDQFSMLSLQLKISSKKNKNKVNDAKEAIELYSKILKKKKAELFYFYRALNYAILKENASAIANYTIVLRFNNKNASARNNRGMCFYELGEYTKAVKDFTSSLKIGADYMAYLSRAESYFHLNKFDKAMEDFEKAIALKIESEGSIQSSQDKSQIKKSRK